MDVGGIRNNIIIIPNPAEGTFQGELQLYTFLLRSRSAREDLLIKASQAKVTSYDDVYLYHNLLLIPLVLPYTNTDQDLITALLTRFKQYAQHQVHLSKKRRHDTNEPPQNKERLPSPETTPTPIDSPCESPLFPQDETDPMEIP